MSNEIIDYPELELGGQSEQTKKGAKGSKKMFLSFRVHKCNDKREFSEYSEVELCRESTFLQYGNFFIEDARKKDGSLYVLESLQQYMVNFKGLIYRTFRKNSLWDNKSPWYSELLKTLTNRLRKRYLLLWHLYICFPLYKYMHITDMYICICIFIYDKGQ
jgi:hypothetical protein